MKRLLTIEEHERLVEGRLDVVPTGIKCPVCSEEMYRSPVGFGMTPARFLTWCPENSNHFDREVGFR